MHHILFLRHQGGIRIDRWYGHTQYSWIPSGRIHMLQETIVPGENTLGLTTDLTHSHPILTLASSLRGIAEESRSTPLAIVTSCVEATSEASPSGRVTLISVIVTEASLTCPSELHLRVAKVEWGTSNGRQGIRWYRAEGRGSFHGDLLLTDHKIGLCSPLHNKCKWSSTQDSEDSELGYKWNWWLWGCSMDRAGSHIGCL